MSGSYIHACYNCGRTFTFSSPNGRYLDLACPNCGHTATYLCPESQWQELDNNARVTLYYDHDSNESARLATENTRGSHASLETTDDSTSCNDKQPPIGSTSCNDNWPLIGSTSCGDKKPLILGLVGAAFFVYAGVQMLGITSEATANGDEGSIFELFYNTMGWFSFGMALLSATLGYMGWKR